MSHYLIQVQARLAGTFREFDGYEVNVQAESEQAARLAARQNMVDRGYETRGTSVLNQWV